MQQWMDVNANNLANVTTTGFKQDNLLFNDAFQKQLANNGGQGDAIGSLGTGVSVQQEVTDFSQGPIRTTDNPLDLALEGSGMFAVQDGNTTRYTRAGDFTLNSSNQLATTDGKPVLDNTGTPITMQSGQIDIARDGTVRCGGKQVATIGIYQGTFQKAGDNLFNATGNTPTLVDTTQPGAAAIHEGAIEGSNVNPLQAMVDMIKVSRVFDMAQKSIQSQDDATGKLIQAAN